MDLTKYIPNQLKNTFLNNAMRLSILNKGVTYKFELTGSERKHVNSILYQSGSALSKLMNIPLSMLKHMKFSKLVLPQLYNVYHSHVPQILTNALSRARVNYRMAWNFLVAITTGKLPVGEPHLPGMRI